jgi:hypothetical protein
MRHVQLLIGQPQIICDNIRRPKVLRCLLQASVSLNAGAIAVLVHELSSLRSILTGQVCKRLSWLALSLDCLSKFVGVRVSTLVHYGSRSHDGVGHVILLYLRHRTLRDFDFARHNLPILEVVSGKWS